MHYIRKQLALKTSKAIRDDIVAYVYKHPDSLEILMECFFDDNNRLNQYASWPVGIIGHDHPEMILPYVEKMIAALEHPKHNAIIRNTYRVFQNLDFPEELEGIVYDMCFKNLDDPKIAVAIRVFCMTTLSNLAIKYPELKEELIPTIELYYPEGSPGYKSRAKKELKRLRK